MMKKTFALALLALSAVPAYSADMNVVTPEVTTVDSANGPVPKLASETFRYRWFQGPSEAELRQVGETPGPNFYRLNQSNTTHCFAVEVVNTSATANFPAGEPSERSMVTCRDFSIPNQDPVILLRRPSRPAAPEVTPR